MFHFVYDVFLVCEGYTLIAHYDAVESRLQPALQGQSYAHVLQQTAQRVEYQSQLNNPVVEMAIYSEMTAVPKGKLKGNLARIAKSQKCREFEWEERIYPTNIPNGVL